MDEAGDAEVVAAVTVAAMAEEAVAAVGDSRADTARAAAAKGAGVAVVTPTALVTAEERPPEEGDGETAAISGVSSEHRYKFTIRFPKCLQNWKVALS